MPPKHIHREGCLVEHFNRVSSVFFEEVLDVFRTRDRFWGTESIPEIDALAMGLICKCLRAMGSSAASSSSAVTSTTTEKGWSMRVRGLAW